MANAYKRAASKRKRTSKRYGGLVKLAAQISGRTIWTVYKVLGGSTTAGVSRAIAEAREQLAAERRKKAAA